MDNLYKKRKRGNNMKKISYLAIVALTAASLSTVTNSSFAKGKAPAPAPKAAAPAPAPKAAAPAPKPPAPVVVAAPAPQPAPAKPALAPAAPKPAPALPSHVQELKSPVVAKAATTSSSNFTYSAPVAPKVTTPAPSYNVSSSAASKASTNLGSGAVLTPAQATKILNDGKGSTSKDVVLKINNSSSTSSTSNDFRNTLGVNTTTNSSTDTKIIGNEIVKTTTSTTNTSSKIETGKTVTNIINNVTKGSVIYSNATNEVLVKKANQQAGSAIASMLVNGEKTDGKLLSNNVFNHNKDTKKDNNLNAKETAKNINALINQGLTDIKIQSWASPEGTASANQKLTEGRAIAELNNYKDALTKAGWSCKDCGTKDGFLIMINPKGEKVTFTAEGKGEVLPSTGGALGDAFKAAANAGCVSNSSSKCGSLLSNMRVSTIAAFAPVKTVSIDTIINSETNVVPSTSSSTTVDRTLICANPNGCGETPPTVCTNPNDCGPTTRIAVDPDTGRTGTSTVTSEVTGPNTSTGTSAVTQPGNNSALTPRSGTSTALTPRVTSNTSSITPSTSGSTSNTGSTSSTGSRTASGSTVGSGSTSSSGSTVGSGSNSGSGVTVPSSGSTLTPSPSSNNAPKPPFKIS